MRSDDLFTWVLLPWVFSLGIGLPLFVVMTLLLRRRTQDSAGWRFLVCFVLSASICPSVFAIGTGHSAVLLVFPAVLVSVAMYDADSGAIKYGFLLGALPVLVLSFVFLAVWTLRINAKRRNIA
jgi:hypothetical protein